MKYEAIESFSGVISMRKGEVRDIPNEALAQELIDAKFIKKYVPDNAKELKNALDKANETITNLEKQIVELNETIANLENEIVELNQQLENKTPNEVEPLENGDGVVTPEKTEDNGTDDVTPDANNSDEQTLITNENDGNGAETSDTNKKDNKTSNKK